MGRFKQIMSVLLATVTMSLAQEYTFRIYESPDLSLETLSESDVYFVRFSATNKQVVVDAGGIFTNAIANTNQLPNLSNTLRIVSAADDVVFTNIDQAIAFLTNAAPRSFSNITNSLALANASVSVPFTNGIGPLTTILTNVGFVKFLNTTTAVEIIRALNNVTITNIPNVTNSIRNGGSAG
jgi:hypothetical protein